MKNFKKILSGVLVASAMASCLALPTYADVVYDDLPTTTNEYGWVTYQLPDDFTIQSVLDDENQTLVLNGKVLKLWNVYVHDHNKDALFAEDKIDYSYEFLEEGNTTHTYFSYSLSGVNKTPESEVTNKTIDEAELLGASDPNAGNVTIGNSNTVGESEPTGVRGDINYDGKVTTVDLLLLKKYLLGIIKWE